MPIVEFYLFSVLESVASISSSFFLPFGLACLPLRLFWCLWLNFACLFPRFVSFILCCCFDLCLSLLTDLFWRNFGLFLLLCFRLKGLCVSTFFLLPFGLACLPLRLFWCLWLNFACLFLRFVSLILCCFFGLWFFLLTDLF